MYDIGWTEKYVQPFPKLHDVQVKYTDDNILHYKCRLKRQMEEIHSTNQITAPTFSNYLQYFSIEEKVIQFVK